MSYEDQSMSKHTKPIKSTLLIRHNTRSLSKNALLIRHAIRKLMHVESSTQFCFAVKNNCSSYSWFNYMYMYSTPILMVCCARQYAVTLTFRAQSANAK